MKARVIMLKFPIFNLQNEGSQAVRHELGFLRDAHTILRYFGCDGRFRGTADALCTRCHYGTMITAAPENKYTENLTHRRYARVVHAYVPLCVQQSVSVRIWFQWRVWRLLGISCFPPRLIEIRLHGKRDWHGLIIR